MQQQELRYELQTPRRKGNVAVILLMQLHRSCALHYRSGQAGAIVSTDTGKW